MDDNKPSLSASGLEQRLSELGGRLAATRLAKNLPQAQLAHEAGISLATLRRLESGQSVQLANWLRVLDVLGLAEGLAHLVPAPGADPLAELERERRGARGRRKRASSPRNPPDPDPDAWTWGEDR